MTRRLWMAIGAVAVIAAGTTAGDAQPSAHLTTFLTFSSAVALPGTTLRPGTYTFELANPWSDLHTVIVRTGDGQRLRYLGQTRLVPRPRHMQNASGVLLGEARRGEPRPIDIWFPAYATEGRQFVYR